MDKKYTVPKKDIGRGLQVSIQNVTPEMAQNFLEVKAKNRNVNKVRLDEYVKAMEQGTWRLSPQAIAFNSDGQLIDGQHRCKAVLQYGEKIPFVIIEGFEPEVMANLDQGRARQPHDTINISLRRRDITQRQTACLRLFLTPISNANAIKLVPSDMVEQFQLHEDAIMFATELQRLIAPVTGAIVRAYYECKTSEEKMQRLQEFMILVDKGQLKNRPVTERDSAALVLRDAIQKSPRIAGGSAQMSWLRKSCHALNAFLEGRSLERVVEIAKDPFPFHIPKP